MQLTCGNRTIFYVENNILTVEGGHTFQVQRTDWLYTFSGTLDQPPQHKIAVKQNWLNYLHSRMPSNTLVRNYNLPYEILGAQIGLDRKIDGILVQDILAEHKLTYTLSKDTRL